MEEVKFYRTKIEMVPREFSSNGYIFYTADMSCRPFEDYSKGFISADIQMHKVPIRVFNTIKGEQVDTTLVAFEDSLINTILDSDELRIKRLQESLNSHEDAVSYMEAEIEKYENESLWKFIKRKVGRK